MHASMALMDTEVSSTFAKYLETATTSAMVRSPPLMPSVALADDEESRHCNRTKCVCMCTGVPMLMQAEVHIQRLNEIRDVNQVTYFSMSFPLEDSESSFLLEETSTAN